jgi:hypothetical protein
MAAWRKETCEEVQETLTQKKSAPKPDVNQLAAQIVKSATQSD